uniref:Uncharacterized protein n=1 Tax=Candidatus Kentrum sp. FM TaxID=2126340 RepID=A0A450SBZ2_9GAMM|nr:MAG: hypothetical protein BECKFM1743C_GA0114222_100762 [Candidatus Kentron sp. FM]VFJ55329.1 MAG: hypothetical protein BECKFM1743A_GA0114220_101472 [Candidatus Kentron sp. FM]VFK08620.1 MAG: hypothetical protein BECKFM1743B_GA0114221_100763 [Candidatus Kentron sp. FM]
MTVLRAKLNKCFRLSLDSGLMADRCTYPSEIDMDGRMFGSEHLGSPLRSPPERRGESCIRPIMPDSPLCPKVAAPPRYFVYFPLGFANGSSFKGALLIQDHALLV